MSGMRTLLVAVVAALVAAPAPAAVDLLERLEARGILSAAERRELEAERAPAALVRGDGLAWTSRDGRFGSRLYGYGQVRYTFQDNDAGENHSGFTVQRVRLGVKGHALQPQLRYKLYLNVKSGKDAPTDLFDYYVDYVPCTAFGVRVGAYKVPYGEQWTTSAGKLQFVERSTVDANFRLDRDTGLLAHGALLGGTLGYELGAFNGEGRNRTNTGDGHLYVARLRLEPLARFAGQESDPKRRDDLALRLSVSAAFNDDVAGHSRKDLDTRLQGFGTSDVRSLGGFAGLQWRGVTARAEYHHRWVSPPAGPGDESRGFYAQGGVMVWRGLEIAARYELFDGDVADSDDLRQEYGGACNWFLAGQRHKVQLDGFRVHTQTGDRDDDRLRIQYQLAF